jgi:hypothetical protein
MDIKDTKICFSSSINLNEPKVSLLKKATLEDMWEQWGVKKKSDGLIPEAELRATPSSELNTATIKLSSKNMVSIGGLIWSRLGHNAIKLKQS